MGMQITKLFGSLPKKQVVVVGLDYAGKTTIAHKLVSDKVEGYIPTIGLYVETYDYKNLGIRSWDVNRSDRYLLKLNDECLEIADALVFVVDSMDSDRLNLAKEELWRISKGDYFKERKLLVFANKSDHLQSEPVDKIQEALELDRLVGDQDWKIQSCVAVTGDGLREGFDWLIQTLQKKDSM
eukprot:TRINITY_DN509_c0_g1_i2.p1 TRINITY_DN509_c0_g1~~TRINITY_DN509_c0_g1_i2.p1  ORF type:complete len:183 (+),score=50.14 TRINITY_DN509_c0_g1_i2:111-659(+)